MDPRERLPDLLAGVGCAACGAPLGADRIVVLAHRDDLAFVELRCAACGSTTLGLVATDDTGDGPPPDVRRYGEFGPADEIRLSGARPIGDDDVRRMRTFLASYDGDLRGLLGDQGTSSRPA